MSEGLRDERGGCVHAKKGAAGCAAGCVHARKKSKRINAHRKKKKKTNNNNKNNKKQPKKN